MRMMHEHIDFPGRAAVKVKWQRKSCFTYPWHFHNEYELLFVIKGEGTSYVADSIEELVTLIKKVNPDTPAHPKSFETISLLRKKVKSNFLKSEIGSKEWADSAKFCEIGPQTFPFHSKSFQFYWVL